MDGAPSDPPSPGFVAMKSASCIAPPRDRVWQSGCCYRSCSKVLEKGGASMWELLAVNWTNALLLLLLLACPLMHVLGHGHRGRRRHGDEHQGTSGRGR